MLYAVRRLRGGPTHSQRPATGLRQVAPMSWTGAYDSLTAAGSPLARSKRPCTLEVMLDAAVMQVALPLLLSSVTTTAEVDPSKLFKPVAPVPPEP